MVAIVGAGAAGLSAARALIAAGKSVVILEAMNRIGGRAFTESEVFGVPFDWGCAWIHSADRNPFFPLAKQWGFDLAEHDDSVDRVYYGSRRFTDKEMKRVKQVYNEIVGANEKAARARRRGLFHPPDPHAGRTGGCDLYRPDGHGGRSR